jgi:hypothetical protein
MHKQATGIFLARSDKGISLENEVKTKAKNEPAGVSGKTR